MKLLHFYYDIMNLYGEYANLLALGRILQKSGIEYIVDKRSFSDEVNLEEYDFIYIGSGTERNRNAVMADMQRYKEALRTFITNDRPILMTGNSFEMLGQSVTDALGSQHEGLGLFHFTVKEQNKVRTTADTIVTADFCDKPLVGFVNKCSQIEGITSPLFDVKMGLGNQENDTKEGFRTHNLFGTHLTGPILIKNPHFLIYLAQLLVGQDKTLCTDYLTYETAAYEVTLSELSTGSRE